MVWYIQIIFDAFIVVMLELRVDGGIRCDAGEELESPSWTVWTDPS